MVGLGQLATTMNSSPQRGSFQRQGFLRRAEEGDTTVEHAEEMIDFYDQMDRQRQEREASAEWRENNLEYDLRSTEWICNKAKAREEYAQNIYAALCNQSWQKNEVWTRLKGQTYSCSWRYAGGIVADMIEKGDYIDWYCSGIRGGATEEDLAKMTDEERAQYDWYQKNFVSESVVTDEIREDLLKLGWAVVEQKEEY